MPTKDSNTQRAAIEAALSFNTPNRRPLPVPFKQFVQRYQGESVLEVRARLEEERCVQWHAQRQGRLQ